MVLVQLIKFAMRFDLITPFLSQVVLLIVYLFELFDRNVDDVIFRLKLLLVAGFLLVQRDLPP